jgi:hypothetical protein
VIATDLDAGPTSSSSQGTFMHRVPGGILFVVYEMHPPAEPLLPAWAAIASHNPAVSATNTNPANSNLRRDFLQDRRAINANALAPNSILASTRAPIQISRGFSD